MINKSSNSKVLFTSELSSKSVLDLYRAYGRILKGNVAIKVHSGEKGNFNFLRPEFYSDIVNFLNGTIVETNTAYGGNRNNTEDHEKLLAMHHWNRYPVDILDSISPDITLEIPHGKRITKNYIGSNTTKYDSLLVISHFKGHPMAGFGGALKQLSIGMASSYGKKYIHGAGDPSQFWNTESEIFLEAMADAASSIVTYFKDRILFINVMKNISVDCDCVAYPKKPCMKDIGMLISNDPLAIDQACIDLVLASTDPGKKDLLERIDSKSGLHILDAAEDLHIGSREYDFIDLDKI